MIDETVTSKVELNFFETVIMIDRVKDLMTLAQKNKQAEKEVLEPLILLADKLIRCKKEILKKKGEYKDKG